VAAASAAAAGLVGVFVLVDHNPAWQATMRRQMMLVVMCGGMLLGGLTMRHRRRDRPDA
jgi:hypothetical protein